MSVSVEWETLSDTAFGISTFTLLGAYIPILRVEIARVTKHTGDTTLERKFIFNIPIISKFIREKILAA